MDLENSMTIQHLCVHHSKANIIPWDFRSFFDVYNGEYQPEENTPAFAGSGDGAWAAAGAAGSRGVNLPTTRTQKPMTQT